MVRVRQQTKEVLICSLFCRALFILLKFNHLINKYMLLQTPFNWFKWILVHHIKKSSHDWMALNYCFVGSGTNIESPKPSRRMLFPQFYSFYFHEDPAEKSPSEPPVCKLSLTSDQDPIQRTISPPSVACRQASSCIPVLLFVEVGEGH